MSVRVKALVLGLAVAAAAAVASYYLHASVTPELRAGPRGERGTNVMLISLESGKTFSVNYFREEGIVWAAADAPWWQELRGGGDGVTVVIEGETIYARARAVEDDEALRSKVFARLRPNAPSSLGVPIEIKLAPSASRKGRARS